MENKKMEDQWSKFHNFYRRPLLRANFTLVKKDGFFIPEGSAFYMDEPEGSFFLLYMVPEAWTFCTNNMQQN